MAEASRSVWITFEDILEQVVGRIEDEYPHDADLSLADTVAAGGIVLELAGSSAEQVIRELAAAIPTRRLPRDVDIAALAVAREAEISTDLGNGVAIPHARCPGLHAQIAVVGRSKTGVLFSTDASEAVHLVFLLVTPAERPDLQLSLIAKIARAIADPATKERLCSAASPAEILETLAKRSSRNPPSHAGSR